MGFLFELRLIENYRSKIIIIMAEQEVLLDDIQQEIITTAAKRRAPTPKKKERLATDILDIPVADIREKL